MPEIVYGRKVLVFSDKKIFFIANIIKLNLNKMEEKQDIISNIRAVLISRKGPATVNELNSQLYFYVTICSQYFFSLKSITVSFAEDYHDLGGTYIPYKKFRFNTLEDFLKSDPTFTLSYHHNETYVAVVPKKESQHISLMIAKQKSPKKKAGSSRMVSKMQFYKFLCVVIYYYDFLI